MLLIHDKTQVEITADSDRLLQVLTNLLSNAVKFSPPNSAVSVMLRPGSSGVTLSVIDQGRGIPADKLEAIFGRFQQVDASDSRQKGGSGLGLAICRAIVQQHNGRIWAERNPVRGSTFRVFLPYQPVRQPRPRKAGEARMHGRGVAGRRQTGPPAADRATTGAVWLSRGGSSQRGADRGRGARRRRGDRTGHHDRTASMDGRFCRCCAAPGPEAHTPVVLLSLAHRSRQFSRRPQSGPVWPDQARTRCWASWSACFAVPEKRRASWWWKTMWTWRRRSPRSSRREGNREAWPTPAQQRWTSA